MADLYSLLCDSRKVGSFGVIRSVILFPVFHTTLNALGNGYEGISRQTLKPEITASFSCLKRY